VAFTGNKNEKQETVVIPEKVYFELNDFKITTEGKVILDKVIQVMKGNPKVNIEVSSHTDSQGSDEYNLDLSKKRAKSAVDYMIGGGVSKDRLAGVGYGETKLVNKCANGELCSEEEHAQNRRLEFKVMYIK
ncbi:MAG: OmpA family protein, partial [Bacteroidia bacterium]|nr:OmpA family protein [Bacteroidia bacterium]